MKQPPSSGISAFEHVLARWDVLADVTRDRLETARKKVKGKKHGPVLTRFVQDLTDDLEAELPLQLGAGLSQGSGRRRAVSPQLADRMVSDGFLVRAFAYSMPALAAASLWDRDTKDPARGKEILGLLARTAVWFLGRAPWPTPSKIKLGGKDGAESEEVAAARIAGLWVSRLGLGLGIPSAFGRILATGLDYFAMWTSSMVADRFYDDFDLSLEESAEVVREAQDFQVALVTALVRTARADGRFSYEEELMLRAFLENLSFSEEERRICLEEARGNTPASSYDVLGQIQDPVHQRFIVARCVEMAFADQRETQPEKELIRRMAKILSLPVSVVQEQEDYINELNRIIDEPDLDL